MRHRWPGHSWPEGCLTTILAAAALAAVSILMPLWLFWSLR